MQKARKDKGKKNVQSIPLAVTQNVNLFSQLSAQYMQSKSVVSEEEKKFMDNTEVIEYHDPQINRILQRLRKKDDTTKVKAILELKEQILKMEQQDIANFASTFCYLFRSLVLNQQSKKVQTEINLILQYILKQYKKLLLPNISILFPALLIFQKVNKINLLGLLFSGDEKSQLQKAMTLLQKPQISKQFLIVSKIIIDKHDKDKLGQSLLQNNCSGLIKSFKQFIVFKQQKGPEQWSQNWNQIYNQFRDIVTSPGAFEFLKQNTRAKAAILEIYAVYIQIASKNNKFQKIEQQMLKQITANFLEKDQIIQYTLWKHCNIKVAETLIRLNRNKQLEEIQSKLLNALEIGGQQLFNHLKQFLQLLPSFKISIVDSTKFLNSFALIKKLNEALLNIQEYNEPRIQAYEKISTYFLSIYQELASKISQAKFEEKQLKRWDQCKKVLQKAQRAIVENLQEFYYKNPPVSKNSFSYYIPPAFANLIKKISALPRLNIHTPLTYDLYRQVATQERFQPIVNQIFNSRKTLDELLEYFQKFPARQIQIQMKGGEINEIYKKCRIYQLTIQFQRPEWFKWQTYYNFFMFDPMLEVKHIAMIQANEQIQFNKKLNIEKMDKFTDEKLNYVQKLLRENSPQIKYYIPSYIRYIAKLQTFKIQSLIQILNEARQKLTVPNTNIIKSVLSTYTILIEHLKTSKLTEKISLDAYDFVLYLFDYNLETQAYALLNKLIQLKDTRHFENILEGMKSGILKRIQTYVDSGEIVEEKKQRLLKKKVDKFIILLTKTLELFIFINQKIQILMLSGQLLQTKYFKYALYRPEIWILLHSIASHLNSAQLQSIIHDLIHSKNNQILGLLVCVNSLYPLQTNLELKRFYQNIYITHISPRLIDLLENNDPKGYELLSDMLKLCQKSLIFSVGVRNLIRQSIIEEIPSENIEKLFKLTVEDIFKNVTQKDPFIMRKSIIIQAILPEFSKFLPNHLNIFEQSLNKVQNLQKQASSSIIFFLTYLDVVTIFWQQKINTNLIFQMDIQSIINHVFSSINKSYTNINFQLQALFNFINVIIENKTVEPFSDYLLDIQKYIGGLMEYNKEKSPQFMSNALIKLCEFLRKILPIIQAFSQQFRDGLFNRVLELCLLKVKQFEKIAEDIDAGVVDQNLDNIILEFSELINRFALVPSISGKQQNIIELLSTRFPSLQKSAFLYLKHLYETGKGNKEVAVYLMKRVLAGQNTDDISAVFSQTLLWILLFIRKMTLSSQNDQLQQFVFLFQKQECSSSYLNFLFRTIEHLGYDETEEQFYCDIHQVSEVALDWSNYMTERELFKLLISSLFIFSSSFPMDLRLWYDHQKDKKLQSLCQKILKNIISDALFNKQIQKIELRQLEWRTEQFDVYAMKKSKEISAEYSNNNAKISLKLKIKDDYPLTPISIESGNQLKIEQKVKKWILKLRSLLYNQNNSICSGIILWKQNIDRQFQGLQQCAICYDIVNNQKQLPKMVCKTCKKKFHSACIRKWFQTSNKSQCPLCKSQFL